jgi:hypothetical protein
MGASNRESAAAAHHHLLTATALYRKAFKCCTLPVQLYPSIALVGSAAEFTTYASSLIPTLLLSTTYLQH